MKINRIKINGYKNLDNIELIFNKITSLLSVNSYGKSNVVEAIDFGIFFITTSAKNKKEMMKHIPSIPSNKHLRNHIFHFEIDFTKKIKDKIYDVVYDYGFDWTKINNPQILYEHLNIRVKDKSQKYSLIINRENNISTIKTSETGRCDKEIPILPYELVVNKILAYDNLYYIHLLKNINDFNIYVDKHFDSYHSYEPNPFIRKDQIGLSLNEENIPRLLYQIREKHPTKYKLIENTVKDIFSFIEELDIREIPIEPKKNFSHDFYDYSDKVYVLYAFDRNMRKPIRFEQMSDGVRRILLICTYVVLAEMNNNALIIIEEPENSINPRLLQKYITVLSSLIEKSQILITSHSPFLINYVNPTYLYLGIPNDMGIARFEKIKKTSLNKIYSEAEDMNMLIGEYLFDLMSGSEEDLETLIRYTK